MNIDLHVHREELEDYFLNLLPREQVAALEAHLDSCSKCALSARRLHLYLEGIKEEMSPKAHRAAAARKSVLTGMAAAVESLSLFARDRVKEWMSRTADALDWLAVDAPLGLESVPTLGEPEEGPETRKVAIAREPGAPIPEVRIVGHELRMTFSGLGWSDPPSVFLVPTAEPAKTRRVELKPDEKNPGSWFAEETAEHDKVTLVIGPSLEPG